MSHNWKRENELIKTTPIAYIRYLMQLPPTALVRLYSYQGKDAWDRANELGYWTGHPEAIPEQATREFGIAYDWMREKMEQRIPGYSGDYPVWGWVRRPSTKNKPKEMMGTDGDVRLTLLVPRSRIIFSDYMDWHSVLNTGYLSRTEDEFGEYCKTWGTADRYHEDGTITPEYMSLIRPSWDNCLSFNPATNQAELDWGVPKSRFIVQACVDRVYWNDVVATRWFTGDPPCLVPGED